MKTINRSFLTLILHLLIHTQAYSGPAIIFDLNGVLFTTNTRAALWHLGPAKIAHYQLVYGKNPLRLKAKLYEILNALIANNDTTTILDDAAIPMPKLMQQWLIGTTDGQSIIEDINRYIEQQDTLHPNSLGNDLVRNLAQIIFDPATFVATRSVIWDGIYFALECKQAGYQIYILSNWDADSFTLLYAQYKDIFDHFDGIMISGTQQTMKPLPTIFHKLLHLYDLTPADCIFIDDQQENIDTAASLGIKTVLCPTTGYPLKQPNFNAVKQAYKNSILTQTARGHESIS